MPETGADGGSGAGQAHGLDQLARFHVQFAGDGFEGAFNGERIVRIESEQRGFQFFDRIDVLGKESFPRAFFVVLVHVLEIEAAEGRNIGEGLDFLADGIQRLPMEIPGEKFSSRP